MDNSIFENQQSDALEMLNQALNNMSPANLLRNKLQLIDDDEIHLDNKTFQIPKESRVWVFGSGKAAAVMAKALEDVLGNLIHDGIIICPYGTTLDCEYIQQFEAGHPYPDENSVAATLEMLQTFEDVRENDIVFYLMSGGSSALLCQPVPELDLNEIRETYKIMLNSGMSIHEVNTIRKHISSIKGGQMRHYFSGCLLINLILSDVPGDDPADIGSGPLIKADSTFKDAWNVIEEHALQTKIPYHVSKYIQRNAEANMVLDDDVENISQINTMLGTAKDLANQVGKLAKRKGYNSWVAEKAYDGEAKMVSREIAGKAISVLARNEPIAKPAVLVHYGESVVHVRGTGKGGRNQELALAASLAVEGQHYITILSVGTDGRDGETDAAGAISTSNTALRARKKNIEPETFLINNDSYSFFKEMNSLIQIGQTGTNLMDLQITIINS